MYDIMYDIMHDIMHDIMRAVMHDSLKKVFRLLKNLLTLSKMLRVPGVGVPYNYNIESKHVKTYNINIMRLRVIFRQASSLDLCDLWCHGCSCQSAPRN